MNTTLVLYATLPLLLVLFGIRRVPARNARPVRRFGRHNRILGPGWHWIVPVLERSGADVDLIGHHVKVEAGAAPKRAELYYQILDPKKAGATLESVDAFVADQAREALGASGQTPDQLKYEVNQRVGRLGLRVIRCSLLVS